MVQRKSFFFTLLILGSFAVHATEPAATYKILKDARAELTFQATTLSEKEQILEQVKMVLNEMFVHRELKLKHFGPGADPMPLIQDLETKLASVSEEEFHGTLSSAFQKLRDWHTTYQFPKPYSCNRAFIPFSLKPVRLKNGENGLAVSVLASEEVLKLVPGLQVKPGDILVSYNGMNPAEALAKVRTYSRGANEDAAIRYGADSLTFFSLKTDLVPKSDDVTLEFQNILGEKYLVTVPWILKTNLDCLKPAATETVVVSGANEYQIDFNQTYKRSKKTKFNKSKAGDDLKETREPTLKYKTITNKNGKFGYIFLESFMPEKLELQEVIQEVKKLLTEDFKDTDGLIYDIRGNGGGLIKLAENMVQLFTPKDIRPLKFRLKNSVPNQFYWFSGAGDEAFEKALRDAVAVNAPMTVDTSTNTVAKVNELGQSYFKPVVVLNDANCYSSCDMFSAMMQDFGVATVFGEDSTTGAGGANNWNLKEMYDSLPTGKKGPFKILPNGQNIGFSLRQTVRVGENEGHLIEDIGVLSDKILPATPEDLRDNSVKQFEILTAFLKEESPKYQSSAAFSQDSGSVEIGQAFTIKNANWTNTDTIEFFANEVLLESRGVEINSSSTEFAFPSELTSHEPKISSVSVIGKLDNKRVWRKVFKIKTTPTSYVVKTDEKLEINFSASDVLSPVIYNSGSKTENGWNVSQETLKIGNTEEYKNNISTVASLFLNVLGRKNLKLSFDVIGDSEKDYDFFKVILSVNGKDTVVYSTSGQFKESAKVIDIPLAESSDKIELSFLFESDGSSVGKGITLDNLKIE